MRAPPSGTTPNRPLSARARLAGLLCGVLAVWLVCEPYKPVARLLGVPRAESESQKESKPVGDESGEPGKLSLAPGPRRAARNPAAAPLRLAVAGRPGPLRPPPPDLFTRFCGKGTGRNGLGAPLRC
jgi:hypothetical protein